MTTSVRLPARYWPSFILSMFALLSCSSAAAFDRQAFEKLDPVELRAAEDRMHEYLEPGSARLLREPRNAAEAYVVERQQRLARNIRNATPKADGSDAGDETSLFWAAGRATQVSIGADGQPRFHCVSIAERLGRTLPDFRRPAGERRLAR